LYAAGIAQYNKKIAGNISQKLKLLKVMID
jgi:hypothetical protein